MMQHVITPSGFELDVDIDRFDDMAFVELLAEAKDDALSYLRIADYMLTPADKARLYEHIRLPDGRVPASAFSRELTDIMSALNGAAKN